MTNKALGFAVPPERERMVGYGSLRSRHGRAGAAVSRAASTSPATASPPPTSMSARRSAWGMEFGTIEKRPAFESYWQRLASRPAALRASQIDDALMAQHPIPGTPAG